MLCRITASFLASATRALPGPDRFAIACVQSFEAGQDDNRCLVHQHAGQRVAASQILPLPSISPG
jgi:hypothetical protein